MNFPVEKIIKFSMSLAFIKSFLSNLIIQFLQYNLYIQGVCINKVLLALNIQSVHKKVKRMVRPTFYRHSVETFFYFSADYNS